MKDKIEAGEYIRTIDGYIRKIDNINTEKRKITIYGEHILDIPYKNSKSVAKKKIVRHSPNIIDLIEVGDYVNGHKVVNEIWGEDDNNLYFEIEGGFNKAQYIGEKDIKSIVTKEMMKSVEYRVV